MQAERAQQLWQLQLQLHCVVVDAARHGERTDEAASQLVRAAAQLQASVASSTLSPGLSRSMRQWWSAACF